MTDGLHDGQGAMTDRTSLRLAKGPLAGPVLCRVVSMVLARAECPLDRLDDALLACEEIAAHGLGYAADGHLTVTLTTSDEKLEMRVGELARQGARGVLAGAMLPGVGNVLERVTDEQRVEPAKGGGSEELVLAISF
jgi:hypothetical protein